MILKCFGSVFIEPWTSQKSQYGSRSPRIRILSESRRPLNTDLKHWCKVYCTRNVEVLLVFSCYCSFKWCYFSHLTRSRSGTWWPPPSGTSPGYPPSHCWTLFRSRRRSPLLSAGTVLVYQFFPPARAEYGIFSFFGLAPGKHIKLNKVKHNLYIKLKWLTVNIIYNQSCWFNYIIFTSGSRSLSPQLGSGSGSAALYTILRVKKIKN